jgi:tRNA modification GTPase
MDLVQAEAVASLIESETTTAARLATRTLQGAFSEYINQLVAQLTGLRTYVEAALDFPEEEIDFLGDGKIQQELEQIVKLLEKVTGSAHSGRLLQDGMTLVIAGKPNAGKSSLLNALAESDTAIVTDTPGTTRDLLREKIQIDGMPLHLIDTAGIRESTDGIEKEGIRRARMAIEEADLVLWVYDATDADQEIAEELSSLPDTSVCLIRNKIDTLGEAAGISQRNHHSEIGVSAKTGEGIPLLRKHLAGRVGYQGSQEAEFVARRRHLVALDCAMKHTQTGQQALLENKAGEILAEELRLAQQALGEITGVFTADDLLGEIFSSFCIGK